jgi:hypothetical protein
MATNKKQVSKYTAESVFVFVGKVVKPKAATMEGLAADNTAIVLVERVISAPDIFTAMVGHRITARFKKASDIKKGASLTFFTNGWIFGESVAVDVVGTAEETGTDATASLVRSASVSSKDSVLRERFESAEWVVAGRVAKVDKSDKGPTYITEHDPNWHESTIDVDEVVKGKKSVKQLKMLFPKSDDVRWHKIGKCAPGQQGVWLLQPGRQQETKGISAKVMAAVPAGPDVLTALHPGDYLPLHELERVRALAGK